MIDNITTDLLCHIVTGGLNAIHSSVFYHNVVKSILDNTGINVNKIIVNPDSNNENEILKILSERGVNIGSVGECTFLDIAINYGLKQIIKQLENSGGKTYKKYYGAAHYQEFVDLNFHQNNRPSTQTSDNSQNNTNSNELTEIPDFLNLIPNSYSNSTDGQGRTTGLNSNQNNQLSTQTNNNAQNNINHDESVENPDFLTVSCDNSVTYSSNKEQQRADNELLGDIW